MGFLGPWRGLADGALFVVALNMLRIGVKRVRTAR
jgi:hypothetical protein